MGDIIVEDVVLFDEGSPEDLACRGFGRGEILELTGFDAGYHTTGLRSATKGVDRMAYKAAHVAARVHGGDIADALEAYAVCSLDVAGVLSRLGLSNPTVCKLKTLFGLLGMDDEFADADRRHRRASMERGMVEKHGVDNPFKLREFQDKAVGTRTERYGAAYTLQDGSSLAAGARETFREHLRDEGFRKDLDARKKATCMERYGVEHPMQDAGVKAKAAKTLMENHGVDAPYKVAAWRDGVDAYHEDTVRVDAANGKRRRTTEERYGVPHWSQTREAREAQSRRMCDDSGARSEKMHETMLERHGVEWGGQTEAHHEAMARTWAEHGEEILDSIRETNLERYGVPYWPQTREARDAQSERMLADAHRRADVARLTMLERYGAGHWMQVPENARAVHDKLVETNRERHGVDYWIQVPENARAVHDSLVRTNRERYGVDYWIQVPENARAVHDAVLEHGLFGVSHAELELLSALHAVYGADDVDWQYSSDERYPFACDFHIKSRDLFIELNGTWTHGGHWYRASDADDSIVGAWDAKGTGYYRNAIRNWTDRDVRKREAARAAGLNYVVFWDGSREMADARLWLTMGCPDGRDWEREYSWLPDRTLYLGGPVPELGDTPRSAVRAARWANGRVLYARELEMWERNGFQGNWGTLQAQLYANRHKYMKSGAGGAGLYRGKLPDELTDLDIVRGLGIMGKLRAHTAFDAQAMREVVRRHGVSSVLDPCAGWGERMATCCQMGIAYHGIDVNAGLADGYARLVGEYGDASLHSFEVGDAASAVVDGVYDAVITCPPYSNLELYTDAGAENLDDAGFAEWWDAVVGNMTPHARHLFCVQTNQACKDVFVGGLERSGWRFLESVELRRRSSHRTRGRGGVDRKREFEEMLVFGR